LGNKFITWAKEWNVPEVWCTEFAFLSVKKITYKESISRFISWLESEPMITHYSPYVASNGVCPSWYWQDCRVGADPSLFEVDLQTLTELGKLYQKIP
jgi:hypothetical protein